MVTGHPRPLHRHTGQHWHDPTTDTIQLLDVPRHLAALGRYDELAAVATQATQMLPGTLAIAAYLAEVRPLIATTERAWALIAELELSTFLAAGDLSSAAQLADTFHHSIEVRALADPTNTEWQRDLSISHNKLGDLAVAAGDLSTAQHHYEVDLAIAERLAAIDPTNAQWQRDLEISQQRMAALSNVQSDVSDSSAGRNPRTLWTAAVDAIKRLSPLGAKRPPGD